MKCDNCGKKFEGFGDLCPVCRRMTLAVDRSQNLTPTELSDIADDCVEWMNVTKRRAALTISGRAKGNYTYRGQLAVPGWHRLKQGTRWTVGFAMKRYQSHQLIQHAQFRFDPMRNLMQITVAAQPGKLSIPVFYLHWEPGGGHHARLHGDWGQTPEFFVTAPMNGCGVIIAGDPKAPHVIHANLDCYELDKAVVTKGKTWERTTKTKAAHMRIYEKFYSTLAAVMLDKDLIGAPVTTFTPQDYLEHGGRGYVFGLKYMDDFDWGWRFYYHVPLARPKLSPSHQLQYDNDGSLKMETLAFTGELWPNRQLYSEDEQVREFLGL